MAGAIPPGAPHPTVGGRATDRAVCVLAPNPSPMTLDGTNTWILAEPDSSVAAAHCVEIRNIAVQYMHAVRIP